MERPPYPALLPIAARTAAALREQASNLLPVVADADLHDTGYALATARTAFEHRAVVDRPGPSTAMTALAALAGDTDRRG